MTLASSNEWGVCKMIRERRLQKMFKQKMNQVAQLFSIQATDRKNEELEVEGEFMLTISTLPQTNLEVHQIDLLNLLLTEFENLFAEPKCLPPTRPVDHTIHLKSHTEPINVRAYRYPPNQKIVIENLVRKMLQKSFIRPSHPLLPPYC